MYHRLITQNIVKNRNVCCVSPKRFDHRQTRFRAYNRLVDISLRCTFKCMRNRLRRGPRETPLIFLWSRNVTIQSISRYRFVATRWYRDRVSRSDSIHEEPSSSDKRKHGRWTSVCVYIYCYTYIRVSSVMTEQRNRQHYCSGSAYRARPAICCILWPCNWITKRMRLIRVSCHGNALLRAYRCDLKKNFIKVNFKMYTFWFNTLVHSK